MTQAVSRANKAIIIAAGRGRRLMPYTDTMPKCMVPVAGRPIVRHELDALRAHGVTDITIIRGYLGATLPARLDELGEGATIRFVENRQWETNNILQSLFCAEEHLEGATFISYSDIVFTADVAGAAAEAPGDFCLVIDRDFAAHYEGRTEHPLQEAEVADLKADGSVARLGKRALPPDQAWGEFIGLMKVSARGAQIMRQVWSRLQLEYAGREDDPFQRAASFRTAYLTDLLQYLIEAGHALTAVGIRGQWREIDTVQDLQRATSLLASNQETWK